MEAAGSVPTSAFLSLSIRTPTYIPESGSPTTIERVSYWTWSFLLLHSAAGTSQATPCGTWVVI